MTIRTPKGPKPYRLVLIEWLDSYGCASHWERVGDFQPSPYVCRSVGWLVHSDRHCKVVVPHMSDPSSDIEVQGCGDMTIPTKAIVSLTELALPKARSRKKTVT